jgi:hypothetical protein
VIGHEVKVCPMDLPYTRPIHFEKNGLKINLKN